MIVYFINKCFIILFHHVIHILTSQNLLDLHDLFFKLTFLAENSENNKYNLSEKGENKDSSSKGSLFTEVIEGRF